MAEKAVVLGLTLTAVGTSAAMMDRVLPPMHELRVQHPSADSVAAVRAECARAAVVVLAIGAGVSTLAKSAMPLAGVAATVGWLWWEYERAARNIPAGWA